MESTKEEIKRNLNSLIGLPLSIARRAVDMLVLHFGTIREVEVGRVSKRKGKKGSAGDFALHIQCPWRFETSDRIVTGKADLYLSPKTGEDFDDDSFYEHGNNLQDKKMSEILQGKDPITGSYMNTTNILVVESVDADNLGGVTIFLSGGFRLVIFPTSSKVESWRLLQPDSNKSHFVVSGSQIESE